MYRLIVESILGLGREADKLRFRPCIPEHWVGFELQYRYRETVYRVAVLRTSEEDGEMRVIVDGIEQSDKTIPLVDDHGEHRIEVKIPKSGQ